MKLTGGQVTSRRIQCLSQCCGIVNPLSISMEVALFNFKTATKEYQDLHPKASQLQSEFLQQRLLSLGLTDKNQQAICRILTAERSQETFRAIRGLKSVHPMHSVSQVEIPGPDGPLHFTTQQEVE